MAKKNKSELSQDENKGKVVRDKMGTYESPVSKGTRLNSHEIRLKQIGARLRKIRLERGYTSYESFAWDHDLPRMQYWRMENGKNFTFISLIKILDALNMSLSEFFAQDFN